MISSVADIRWSMPGIGGQLPNETGEVNEGVELADPKPLEPFDLNQQMFYEAMGDFEAEDHPLNGVLDRILSFLPPKQLVVAGGVSKFWHQLASRDFKWQSYCLEELFPLAPVIDRNVWDRHVNLEQHGLVFEKKGSPCVENKRQYFELLRMASEVEDGQGISILTLPKGLSLSKIVAFAAAPKVGNATHVNVLFQRTNDEQGDIELQETITVAISNGVFKDSRNMEAEDQNNLVKGLKCEMSQGEAIMALAILRFTGSDPNNPLRLFGDDPGTYTRFMEITDGWHLVFGGFDPDGPNLFIDSRCAREVYGVGGMRKLAARGF